ncbi:hypothetical protein THRCLA_08932 [Thraustotheca clavata]|uniref:Uncharacterized protein n=1 Tax=Thraustotheca clavata TaxID=74557 RepID=A0A1V9Z0S9_9STRA|nr:hypothetical protein THRCLA_08932 [Thraustotheca clavata]
MAEQSHDVLTKERSCVFEGRVEDALQCKKLGAEAQKSREFVKAVEYYDRALYHVEFDEGTWSFELMDKHRDAVNAVRLPVYLNLAACYLDESLMDNAKVHEYCELALDLDTENVKALYRKGIAYLRQNDLDSASFVLREAVQLQPHDKAIRVAIAELKQKLSVAKKVDKEKWGGWLNKHEDERSLTQDSDTPKEEVKKATASIEKAAKKPQTKETEKESKRGLPPTSATSATSATSTNNSWWTLALAVLVLASAIAFYMQM